MCGMDLGRTIRSETLERCLACEAVVSRGTS